MARITAKTASELRPKSNKNSLNLTTRMWRDGPVRPRKGLWTIVADIDRKNKAVMSSTDYKTNISRMGYFNRPSEYQSSTRYHNNKIHQVKQFGDSAYEDEGGVPKLHGDLDLRTTGQRIREYLLNATLHGLRYIGEAKLSIIERVFWFLAFCMVFITSAYFIGNIYQRWDENPVIVSINPKSTLITTIPFPAITICNMNQAKKSRVENLSKHGDKWLLNGLCQTNVATISDEDIPAKYKKWEYFQVFLLNVSQTCNEMLRMCTWLSTPTECEGMFNNVLTDEGLCCTFNSLPKHFMYHNPDGMTDLNNTMAFESLDWNPEDGYPTTPKNITANYFPRRPVGAGSHMGLTLIMDANVFDYFCSSTESYGFKVLLHNPVETPKMADFGFVLETGVETRVVITPQMSDAAYNIRSIDRNKRNCVFADEAKLIFFRTYTKKNCEMECESRHTLDMCNCTQYYMPSNDESSRICGSSDLKCYTHVKTTIEDKQNTTLDCTCMPACFELKYTKESSNSELGIGTFKTRLNFSLNHSTPEQDRAYAQMNIAIVHFYFVDTSFTRLTKGELFGFTDFLSNTGGLLGLFMGFSVLSVVEIVYFLTLRPWCAHYRTKRVNSDK